MIYGAANYEATVEDKGNAAALTSLFTRIPSEGGGRLLGLRQSRQVGVDLLQRRVRQLLGQVALQGGER